jgi:riboflavin transporter FmnP
MEEDFLNATRRLFVGGFFICREKEFIMSATKTKNLRALVVTAIMGAVGFVLMFLEFGVPIMPSFIKFDFSELPALIASFAYGPLYGVAVCFLKNALHLLVTSTAGVGELANFLMGIFFVVPAGWIYRACKNRKSALMGSLVGAVAMGIACVLINYFLIYPIYYKVMIPEAVILSFYQAILPSMDSIWKSLLIFNLPFTTVKGLVDALICFLIYKKLSPILKKT